MKFTPICALIALLFSVNANAFDCQAGHFNAPVDTSTTTWYPLNFNETEPPLFPNNFNCLFNIMVPVGWSAVVRLTMNMTIPSDFAVSVRVFDNYGNSDAVYTATNEHFYFISNGGSIQLNTRQQNVRFGFNLRYYKSATVFDASHGNVTVSDLQPATYWAYLTSPIQIKADTRVSLVVKPPRDDETFQFLRGVMVYDGPDWNSKCLGNLLEIVKRKQQLVSSRQYMSVSMLSPYPQTGRTMLVFQDYQNTKDVVQYQGFACDRIEACGTVSMDGTNGPAAIATVMDDSTIGAEYLNSASGSGTLEVYIGGKTTSKANVVATYNLNETSLYLPQEFLGYVRTYVLTGTNAFLNFTRSSSQFSSNARIGRKGFFASRYFKSGSPSKYQDGNDFLRTTNSQVVNFSFSIVEAYFVGNTTLRISVYSGSKCTYNQTYTSSNQPTLNVKVQALGDRFSSSYNTYGYSTNGFYMNYELLKSSGAPRIFVIISFYFFIVLRLN